MAKRTVIWTETAVKQRRHILAYWINRNKSTIYSEKLIRLIQQKVKAIERSPESFRKTDYINTMIASMGHFSIYYQSTSIKIIIVAFWDNRQDPSKLLKIIK